MSCTQCGKCCLTSPCQIPVIEMEPLRYILVNEFHKPAVVNAEGVDILTVMFRYSEDILPTGQIHGYFIPLPGTGNRCMWLEKNGKKYTCKLFWNKTATELLHGFAENVVGKGKGCSFGGVLRQPVLPMVYRDGKRALAYKQAVTA